MRNKRMQWVGIGSIVLVSLLTILLRVTSADFLLYPLFPGEIASLAITGAHGGTNVEEFLGTLVGLIINVLLYFAALELLLAIRRRMRDARRSGTRPTPD